MYLFLTSKVKNIIIKNNNIYNDEEILKMTGLDNYPKFITISEFLINKKLKKDILIDKVDIKRKFHNKIIMYVKEKRVLFYYKYNNRYLLDKNIDIDLKKDITRPIIINYVPDKVRQDFVKSFNNINDLSLMKISEIKYEPSEYDNNRFLFYMNDGNYVYINNANMDNLSYYAEIVKVLEGKKGILYLDNGDNEAVQFKIIG